MSGSDYWKSDQGSGIIRHRLLSFKLISGNFMSSLFNVTDIVEEKKAEGIFFKELIIF